MNVGIICEYNPLHTGHSYQLSVLRSGAASKSKEKDPLDNAVICVMSGNYVQRSEPALFDKFTRTKMALKAGADLVIELPTLYSTATAEWFAFGAVSLLQHTHLAEGLSFGMEHPAALATLREAADFLVPESAQYRALLKKNLEEGSFASSRQQALETLLQKPLPTSSNDILVLEYLKAIKKTSASLTPLPLQRTSDNHRSSQARQDTHLSGLAIRKALQNKEDISPYLATPSLIPQTFCFAEDMMPALLFALAKHTPESLSEIDEVSEGLENRILRAAFPPDQHIPGYEELVSSLTTKRYPSSRIKRILLNTLLSITRKQKETLAFSKGPQYLRVLGVREESLPLLSLLTKTADIPVITNLARQLPTLSEPARSMLEKELEYSRIYHTLNASCPACEKTAPLIIRK